VILVIDNYDSFTWNLVHYLMELGAQAHFPPYRSTGGKWARHLRKWVIQNVHPTVQPSKRYLARSLEGQRDARVAALDRATFLVARAISRRGLRGRFFIQAAFRAVEPQVESVVSGMVAHLEAEWDKIRGPSG